MRQAELRYYPYGKTRYTYGATPTTFRFTGQRQQANANELYFYQSRWYDPLVGRFLSADTIVPDPSNPQSLNRYTYVGNSPLRYVDPTGHAEQTPDEDETALLAYWKALAELDPGRLDGEIWAWLLAHQDMRQINGLRAFLEQQFGSNTASIPAAFDTIYAAAYAGGELLALSGDPSAPLLAGAICSAIALSDPQMGEQFRGGQYSKIRAPGKVRHHMPAKSVNGLSEVKGPAIQMDPLDHLVTSSWGPSNEAKQYRQSISNMIEQGRMRDAMAVEIWDIRRVAGSKYNSAIQDLLEYGKASGYIPLK